MFDGRSIYKTRPPSSSLSSFHSHLVQVLYLVGEVVELFHKERFLPQCHKGQVSLCLVGLVHKTNETGTAKRDEGCSVSYKG